MHLTNPEDLQMQAGESDEIIQFLKHQAERGAVESQVRSHDHFNYKGSSVYFPLAFNSLTEITLHFKFCCIDVVLTHMVQVSQSCCWCVCVRKHWRGCHSLAVTAW